MDFTELPSDHPFIQLLLKGLRRTNDKQEEEINYQAHKSMLTPSWRDVIDKTDSFSYFINLATMSSNHVLICSEPECYLAGLCQFASVTLFIAVVVKTIGKMENPEAPALAELWSTRDSAKLEFDPRYIAFRCAWDAVMIQTSILRESMRDPFAQFRSTLD